MVLKRRREIEEEEVKEERNGKKGNVMEKGKGN